MYNRFEASYRFYEDKLESVIIYISFEDTNISVLENKGNMNILKII